MFKRTVNGIALRFHLAGINNQNFLMRDEQTGTFWQQITGLAIAGPLAGHRLDLVPADELSFTLWKNEQPQGSILQDEARFAAEYAPENWDAKMARVPTALSYAQPGLKPSDLMLGVHTANGSRAFPYNAILKAGIIDDGIGPEPILLLVGPDGTSVRVFERRIPGLTTAPQFYRALDTTDLFLDGETASYWNFEGCAQAGKLKGICLEQIPAIKDYWFDWRHYHPETTVFGIHQKIY